MRKILILLVCLVNTAQAGTPAQTPAQTPETLVSALYDGADFESHLSRSLGYLFEQDHIASHGEVGAISANPLCDCQDGDVERLMLTRLPVAADGASAYGHEMQARVRADFVLGFGPGYPVVPRHVEFVLLRLNGQWKLDDIVGESGSMRMKLEAFIAEYGH